MGLFDRLFGSRDRAMPDDFADARAGLRPKIWPRLPLEMVRIERGLKSVHDLEGPLEDLGDHLLVGLVYDLPKSQRIISKEQLEAWDSTFATAMQVARQNLADEPTKFQQVTEGVYESTVGDSYEESRLLLIEVIARLDVQGQPVVMVPRRGSLFVTGCDDEQGLRRVLELVTDRMSQDNQAGEESEPLVTTMLRLRGDRWIEWMPSQDHVVYDGARVLQLDWLAEAYEWQTSVLKTLDTKRGIKRHLAPFENVCTEDGVQFSFCTWGNLDVESSLPQTERVLFFTEEDEEPTAADWGRVESVVGHLLDPLRLYPPRFQATGFPSEEELAMIGKNFLPPAGGPNPIT